MSFDSSVFMSIGSSLSRSLSKSQKLPIKSPYIDNTIQNEIELNNNIFNFSILLSNTNTIQIQIIDYNTMNQYGDILQKEFTNDYPILTSINTLFKLLSDAILQKDMENVYITLKLANAESITFNIIYKTKYEKYIIPITVECEKMSAGEKQRRFFQKIMKDNYNLKNKIIKLEEQLLNFINLREFSSTTTT